MERVGVCYCGHSQREHGDTLGGIAKGHGECLALDCDCRKFTWERFEEQLPEPEDKE